MIYAIVLTIVIAIILLLVSIYYITINRINLLEGFCICICCFIVLVILVPRILVIDTLSGTVVGELYEVDRDTFGTYKVYIKTEDTEKRVYCIEDEDLALRTKELKGRVIKAEYKKRVGIYSLDKCNQAPIISVEEDYERY